jgi:2-furoyl-CoA dehydrogenase large subunit
MSNRAATPDSEAMAAAAPAAGPAAAPGRASWLGRPLERFEDAALLTGRGRFADDIGERPGTLHAAILRSPHAHARILSVDASAALAMKGVRAVLTGADLRAWSAPFVVGVKQPMEHWCLAVDKVRYAGEPVAVVVAEDRYLAEDALDAVRVDYQPLPAVAEPSRAAAAGAPVLHEAVGSNVVSERRFAYGDAQAQFDAPDSRRVQVDVRFSRNSCTPIEGFVVLAEHLPGDEGYEVLSNFMGPFSIAAVMALALKVPASRLRLRSPRDSGGSFGIKQGVFPYAVAMCLASRKAGAPVKWVQDRLEHLQDSSTSTARVTTLAAAVGPDGRIRALDWDQLDDCGGYLRAPEPATFYRMHGALSGAYDIRHLKVRNRVVLTNRMPAGLNRGFGGPQVYLALERLMQKVAVELGLDPLEVYRRNFVPSGAFPYRAAAGALYDSGDYPAGMELALREGGHDELLARRDAARREGRIFGIGYAAIVEPSISNMGYITTVMTPEARAKAGPKNGGTACATVAIDALGAVSCTVASVPQGQGHITVCAQVLADVFGLAPRDIMVNVELDTARDAWTVASGNYSSRFAGAVAGTVHLAGMRLRDKLARIAAPQLGCAPEEVVFAGGKVAFATAPDKSLGFARLAGGAHWAPALLPQGEEPGLRETVFWTPECLEAPDAQDHVNTSAAYGFAFDVCALEIERDTGRVRIDRYVTAHDAGTLLNPALADGQIRGAFAQGLGVALMEEFAWGEDGSFLSGTFADYLVPTTMEVPEPVILHMESPSPFTPLGAKGLGEGNNMSTPVCIANAISDALAAELGARFDPDAITLPMTPSRILALLEPEERPPAVPVAKRDTPASGHGLSMRGTVRLQATPEQVFAVLMDPQRLARVVPGCKRMEATGPGRYAADVVLGVGLVKARFQGTVLLSEVDAPRSLRLSGGGSGALGSTEGSGTLRLEPAGDGCQLHYDYGVSANGKIAAVGARLLEGATVIVLEELFARLGDEAAGQAGGEHRAGGIKGLLRGIFGGKP